MGSIVLAAAEPALEPKFDAGPFLTLTEENDFVVGTDRWYTQGAKVAYTQAENDVPGWAGWFLDAIPKLGFTPGADRIGYELGQGMYTPENPGALVPDPHDRPFAGWLYTGLMLDRSGMDSYGYLTLENFQVDIGVIGPWSLARDTQDLFHHNLPPGWHQQLENEPGIAVKYGRAWLVPMPSAAQRYIDFIPMGGLSLGNVDTSFRAGATFRAGYNLPDNMGVQPMESIIPTQSGWSASRAGRQWGFYIFGGVEARAVLFNEFLDGNMYHDSPSVQKEPLVGELRTGIVVVLNRVELAYTQVYRTREFRDQHEGQMWGSISINCKF